MANSKSSRDASSSDSDIFSIKWNNSSDILSKNTLNFASNKQFTDCVLSSEGKFIYAHRVILASASRFFEVSYFNSISRSISYAQSSQNLFLEDPSNKVVHFHSISYMNLCLLMKYVYTGEVLMAENRIQGFLEAAKSLDMFGLMEDYKGPEKQKKKKKKRSKSSHEAEEESATQDESEQSEASPLFDTDHNYQALARPERGRTLANRKRRQNPEDIEYGDENSSEQSNVLQPVKRAKTFICEFKDRCRYCLKSFYSSKKTDINLHEFICSKNPLRSSTPPMFGFT
jgi:BTB/POZ domain